MAHLEALYLLDDDHSAAETIFRFWGAHILECECSVSESVGINGAGSRSSEVKASGREDKVGERAGPERQQQKFL